MVSVDLRDPAGLLGSWLQRKQLVLGLQRRAAPAGGADETAGEELVLDMWGQDEVKFLAAVLGSLLPGYVPAAEQSGDDEATWTTALAQWARDKLTDGVDWSLWMNGAEPPSTESIRQEYRGLAWPTLLWRVVASKSEHLCHLVLVINLAVNPNLMALLPVVLALCVAMVAHPRPGRGWWLFLVCYSVVAITLKFLVQLDFVCIDINSHFSLQPNPLCPPPGTYDPLTSLEQVELPYLVGLYKDPTRAFAAFVFWDLMVILVVAFHRHLLSGKGVWLDSERGLLEREYRPLLNGLRARIREEQDRAALEAKRRRDAARLRSSAGVAGTSYQDFTDGAAATEEEEEAKETSNSGSEDEVGRDDGAAKAAGRGWRDWLPTEVDDFLLNLEPPLEFQYRQSTGTKLQADMQELYIKTGTDLYMFSFCCEFLAALHILLFFYAMATTSDSTVQSSLNSNLFPGAMVINVFVQVGFILVERTVYLARSVLAKWVLQCLAVVYWSVVIFVQWPVMSQTGFYDNTALRVMFLYKCLYFVASAMQIRKGYPSPITPAASLMNDPGYYAGLIFSTYRSIPFVFELQTMMDWMLTSTSLDLWQTFKLEDINAMLFITQCNNVGWLRWNPRGRAQRRKSKFCSGFLFFFALLFIVLFPLLLFSSASPASTPNSVTGAEFEFTLLGPSETFHLGTIRSMISANVVSPETYARLKTDNVIYDDKIESVQSVQMAAFSSEYWAITPPSLAALEAALNSTGPAFGLRYAFTRPGPDLHRTIEATRRVAIAPAVAEQLREMLLSSVTPLTVVVPGVVPLYLRLPLDQSPNPLGRATDAASIWLTKDATAQGGIFWSIHSTDARGAVDPIPPTMGVNFITVSNPLFSQFVEAAGISYSIVAVYIGVVLTVGRFVRMLFANAIQRVFFEDMLNTEPLLLLCEAIRIARHQRSLYREHQLYRRLIFILRNPQIMVRLTRRPDWVDTVEYGAKDPGRTQSLF